MVAVYEKLRERLDKFPQGFPATKSGTELKILESLFTPEEAEIALHVKPEPEKPAVIARRMGKDEKQMADKLYSMSRKGLILRKRESGGDTHYALVPWIVGIYEHRVKNMSAQDFEQYTLYNIEGPIANVTGSKVHAFRVLPVEAEIPDGRGVQPYEMVSRIIEKNSRFAVAECICRKGQKITGHECGKTIEACLSMGTGAEYYIENGWAREITKQEAMQLLEKAEQEGLVHQCTNCTEDNLFICNCCGCCCGMLQVINFGVNTRYVASQYRAVKDQEMCTVCRTCVDRCQVHAVKEENGRTDINPDLCIGCGLCVSTCPSGAVKLVRKAENDMPADYSTEVELVRAMGREKSKAFPFE